jgi:2-amino-4-hydroxy-6-hydroxymethyldihydropteridine diphosphokinase
MSNISLLSLGANQQDPIRCLNIALQHIQKLPLTHIRKSSKIIPTPAFGVTQQQHFFNMVLEIETNFSPLDLLKKLQHIEKKMGRIRRMVWGPRLIDIDILTYNDLSISHPILTLPHPQIHTRPFIASLIADLTSLH